MKKFLKVLCVVLCLPQVLLLGLGVTRLFIQPDTSHAELHLDVSQKFTDEEIQSAMDRVLAHYKNPFEHNGQIKSVERIWYSESPHADVQGDGGNAANNISTIYILSAVLTKDRDFVSALGWLRNDHYTYRFQLERKNAEDKWKPEKVILDN
ncbi:MAG: hypothetical protein LBJ12_01285 [Oscillospiraceae bacterium]|jgi:hypothetical protein|nr:hypothetical protein [Oscillospiraceae bacterium]